MVKINEDAYRLRNLSLLAQAVGVRAGTGNDISGHYKHHYFPPIFFLCHDLFLLKESSDQKTYLAKIDGSA